MKNKIIKTILFAAMILMVGTIGTVQASSFHELPIGDIPTWMQLAERYNVDPTTFPGYGCHHGHRSFGC